MPTGAGATRAGTGAGLGWRARTAARKRPEIAVAEKDEAGPCSDGPLGRDGLGLRLAQRLGEGRAGSKALVERLKKRRRVLISNRPAAANHRLAPGLEEGSGKAQHAFAAQDGSRGCLTRREHDDAAIEIEAFDLARLKEAVFAGGARGEEHCRALGAGLVGDGVDAKCRMS